MLKLAINYDACLKHLNMSGNLYDLYGGLLSSDPMESRLYGLFGNF